MKGANVDSGGVIGTGHTSFENRDHVTASGLHVRMINGEPYYNIEELDKLVELKVAELVQKVVAPTNPQVQSAKQARETIDALHKGLGGDMDRFEEKLMNHVNSLKATRLEFITACNATSQAMRQVAVTLREAKQNGTFDMVNEFATLCERFVALDKSGTVQKIMECFRKLEDA